MFWLKNQNNLKRLRNAMKLYKSFLCIFIDVSANNELKVRFIGQDFRFVFLVFDTLKIHNLFVVC